MPFCETDLKDSVLIRLVLTKHTNEVGNNGVSTNLAISQILSKISHLDPGQRYSSNSNICHKIRKMSGVRSSHGPNEYTVKIPIKVVFP